MKRLSELCLILLLILAAALPARASSPSATTSVLSDLSSLLNAREQIYEQSSEAFTAVSQFLAQNDYAALLHARIVCDQALREVQSIAIPAMTLSDAEILSLIQSGVEVDALEVEIASTLETRRGAYLTITRLETALYADVYQVSMLGILKDNLLLEQQLLSLDEVYDRTFANYLLIPLSSDAAVMDFYAQLPDRYPLIGANLPAWESDPDKLYDSIAQTNIAGRENQLDDSSALLGQGRYALDQFADSIAAEERAALLADTNVIADMPHMLPLPEDWLLCEDTLLDASYDDPNAPMPSLLTMKTRGIPLSSLNAYIDLLAYEGASVYKREGSDTEGWKISVVLDQSLLLLTWKSTEEVIIDYRPETLSLESHLYILCTQP